MLPLLILVGLIVVVVAWVVGMYNGLVGLRNQVKESWAQVDVQLKRRFDLIPNLMETVKGYMSHERETLEAVTQARAAISGAGGMPERMAAEGGLTAALGRLFAVSESYPDLKASTNFLSLQEELASTENKISFSRQFSRYRLAITVATTQFECVTWSAFPRNGVNDIPPHGIHTISAGPLGLAGNCAGLATQALVQIEHHCELMRGSDCCAHDFIPQ